MKSPKIYQLKIPSTIMRLPEITPLGCVVLAGRKEGWDRTMARAPPSRTLAVPPAASACTFVLGFHILLLVDGHFVHINVLLIATCSRRVEDQGFT